jgi:flagellar motor protein MotB
VVDAAREENYVSRNGQSLFRGRSIAEAFSGAEGRIKVGVESGSDLAAQRLRQRAGQALSIGGSTLVIFVFMCIFAIMCIAWKMGTQAEEIDKLHTRARGLYQDWMNKELEGQNSEAKKRALKEQLAQDQERARAELAKKKEMLAREQDVLKAQQAAIDADKATIAKQREKIKGLAREDKSLIDQILQRNKVSVDLDKKIFKIVEPIEFKSVHVKPGMKHAPPAEFSDPQAAQEVLSDLAQILEKVTEPRLMIEGHTAGGSKAVSDIGFEIACERAEKVVQTLVKLGVPKCRLESKGKPGLLGDNKFDTKIITLSWD